MAHGGAAEWNQAVLDAVASFENDFPVEVAFGMADAVSIQEAVHRLQARGVRKIGVVRLFVSGESWYERTRQILGLSEGAPVRPAGMDGHDHGSAHGEMVHRMEFWRVETHASFAMSKEGLAEAREMGPVLADRARTLSREAEAEDVLILAHGPGADAENQMWLAKIDTRADAVRDALPFPRVQVETLREDWPEKREVAEKRIRSFVKNASDEGGTAIVIPFRVQGFGPYADVLEGLDYVSDGLGLLPHANVEIWIKRQAEELASGSFEAPVSGGQK